MARHSMNNGYFLAGSALIILLMLSQSCAGKMPEKSAVEMAGVPDIKRDCKTCHISHTMGGALLLKEPLSKLCLQCHPDRKAPAEHIVDIVPSMKVTALPLKEGRMTCVTCHDPHGKTYASMLRVIPKDLCQLCHQY
jgi:predicted CXXCH cytochrome family protein